MAYNGPIGNILALNEAIHTVCIHVFVSLDPSDDQIFALVFIHTGIQASPTAAPTIPVNLTSGVQRLTHTLSTVIVLTLTLLLLYF